MVKNHGNIRYVSARLKNSIRSLGFLSLLICCSSFEALANTGNDFIDLNLVIGVQESVSGTIIDNSGTPLPGATVLEKGTTNGTQTDFDGNYTLDVAVGATLVVSYIGFAAQEIPVNGQAVIDITMEEDASQLDEVVLVGYGTQSRASVTNAISSVNSEELTETPAIGVSQALQGRAAGVQVTNTGTPGSNPLVVIRGIGTFGNNQPLFIVDGVPTGSLNSIAPESIESVDILKDASSTAIYGSRGSNGVVLIKTKGGKRGKPVFKFNTYAGVSENTKTLDVLSADQYRQYASEAYDADPVAEGTQIYGGLQPGNFDPSINTNWQDEVLRSGVWQNYDVEASGGSEGVNYSVRSGYLKQEGTLITTDFERYSLGINTSIKLSDKITIGETFNLGVSRTNNDNDGVLVNALRFDPTRPVFDDETNYFSTLTTAFDGQDAVNPVRLLRNGTSLSTNTQMVGSLYGSYEFLPGLTYKLTLGLDHSYNNFDGFDRSIPTGSRSRDFALTNKTRNKFLGTVITNTLNYSTTVSDVHNLDILAGYERNKFDFDQVQVQTANPLTDIVENLNQNDVRNLSSFTSPEVLQSVFGRVSYDYDRIFLLSGTARSDKSSKFPINKQDEFFSASAGVNLSRLAFLENNEFISLLKLRGSYGTNGNNNIDNFAGTSGLVNDFNYVIDGELQSGTRPSGIPNPNLRWETLSSLNIGADLGFMDNALTISLEYFDTESDGLLISVPLPPSLGATDSNQIQNVGGTTTSGFEVDLGYTDGEGDFTWGANFNLFANLNSEVTSLGSVDAIFNGSYFQQNHNRLFVGEAPFHFFGYQTDGIFQNPAEVAAHATQNQAEPGNIRYVDTNNDGEINAEDRVIIGDPNTDLSIGFDVNFKFKAIDFSVFLNGVYGNDIYNGNRYNLEQQARLFNVSTVILDRWTPTNPSNLIPKATPGFTGNELVSDRFVEDGSYTRIRNATLGFTVPSNVLDRIGNDLISNLRVYVSGQNLITFTDYSGYDPEIQPILSGGTTQAIGLDQGRYPQPRTILAGLQVKF